MPRPDDLATDGMRARGLVGVPADELLAQRRAGATLAAIGARYGVSGERVRQVLRAAGAPATHDAARLLDDRQGATLTAIAVATGRSRGAVGGWLRQAGIRPRHERAVDATTAAAVVRRYRAGETGDALAADYHTAQKTIRAILRDAGVAMRPRATRPFLRDAAGTPLQEIGLALRRARQQQARTQRDIAALVESPYRNGALWLLRVEAGRYPSLTPEQLRAIGRALDLPDSTLRRLLALLGGTTVPAPAVVVPSTLPHAVPGVLERDGDHLVCGVCGRSYRHLAQHARLAHTLTAMEYRALAGLNRQTRLVADDVRARLREVTAPTIARLRAAGKLRNWGEDPARFALDKAAAMAALRAGKTTEGKGAAAGTWTDARRQRQAWRTAARNRSGELRAAPAAIGAGQRRRLAMDPAALAALREQGRRAGKARRRLDDATVTDLARRYRDGASLDELAALSGTSYGTVRRELLAAGVALRPPHRATSNAAERVRA